MCLLNFLLGRNLLWIYNVLLINLLVSFCPCENPLFLIWFIFENHVFEILSSS